MPSDSIIERAAARLRAAGVPEDLAATLAGRVAGVLEQLRRQTDALPPAAEPATTFTAGHSGVTRTERPTG